MIKNAIFASKESEMPAHLVHWNNDDRTHTDRDQQKVIPGEEKFAFLKNNFFKKVNCSLLIQQSLDRPFDLNVFQ